MADDVASLGFEMDSGPLQQTETMLRALEAAAKRAGVSVEEMQRRVSAASQQSTQNTQKSTTATNANTTATNQAAAAATRAAREAALVGRVLGAAAGEAQSLAGALGRAAPFLTSLGPAGLAAAAGLGAVVIAFKKVSDAALELADRAGDLRDLSETVGFTTDQLQALERAAGQVGVTQQQLSTGIERFSASLAEIKDRTGGAYDALVALDPVVAKQASGAKSVAEAWDLVFRAVQKAGNEERNQAARAIFGRGGIPLTRVGGTTADAGGVQAYTNALQKADFLTKEQIKSWDDLGDSIRENTRLASQIVTSLFAGPVLEILQSASDKFHELAIAAKGVDWESVAAGARLAGRGIQIMIDPLGSAIKLFQQLRGTARDDPASGSMAGLPDAEALEERAEALAKLADAANEWKKAATDAAADSKRLMEALGSTATPAERLRDQVLQLNAQVARGKIEANDAATAQRRLNAAFSSSQIQATVSALGSAATATEEYAAKVDALTQKVREQGLSQETLRRGRAGLASDEALRVQRDNIQALGEAATETERYGLAQAELSEKLRQGKISQDAFNRGLSELKPGIREAKELSGDFASGFARDIARSATAVEALHNAIGRLTDALIDMAARKLVAQAFGAASTGGLASVFGLHSGGVVGSAGTQRFVNPMMFIGAPRLHSGLGSDEFPAILQRGERVIPKSQASTPQGAPVINSHFYIEGAVGKEEVVGMIQQGMAVARRDAVAISTKNVPNRLNGARLLGN